MFPAPPVHPLPLRCRPSADEDLNGFLLRLAERNLATHPAEILGHVGVRYPAPYYAEHDLIYLGALAGISCRRLAAMQPRVQDLMSWDAPATWHSVELRLADLSWEPRRICPACIGLSPHQRWWWTVEALGGCPEHGSMFLTRCPSCCRRLSHERSPIAVCPCGTKYSEVETPAMEPEMAFASRYIVDRLRRQQHAYGGSFDRLPLSHAIRTASQLGSRLLGRVDHAPSRLGPSQAAVFACGFVTHLARCEDLSRTVQLIVLMHSAHLPFGDVPPDVSRR
ncbi:TniQ family protein [Roseomonas populi]|uniref:TniQ family protein n=1 Tax=Roseomonas populi TaxID=3121582 RepID=UPI0038CD96E1